MGILGSNRSRLCARTLLHMRTAGHGTQPKVCLSARAGPQLGVDQKEGDDAGEAISQSAYVDTSHQLPEPVGKHTLIGYPNPVDAPKEI